MKWINLSSTEASVTDTVDVGNPLMKSEWQCVKEKAERKDSTHSCILFTHIALPEYIYSDLTVYNS